MELFAASVVESRARKYFKIKDDMINYSFMTKCVETTPEGENRFKFVRNSKIKK